jgi:hypothetical protein
MAIGHRHPSTVTLRFYERYGSVLTHGRADSKEEYTSPSQNLLVGSRCLSSRLAQPPVPSLHKTINPSVKCRKVTPAATSTLLFRTLLCNPYGKFRPQPTTDRYLPFPRSYTLTNHGSRRLRQRTATTNSPLAPRGRPAPWK